MLPVGRLAREIVEHRLKAASLAAAPPQPQNLSSQARWRRGIAISRKVSCPTTAIPGSEVGFEGHFLPHLPTRPPLASRHSIFSRVQPIQTVYHFYLFIALVPSMPAAHQVDTLAFRSAPPSLASVAAPRSLARSCIRFALATACSRRLAGQPVRDPTGMLRGRYQQTMREGPRIHHSCAVVTAVFRSSKPLFGPLLTLRLHDAAAATGPKSLHHSPGHALVMPLRMHTAGYHGARGACVDPVSGERGARKRGISFVRTTGGRIIRPKRNVLQHSVAAG